MPLRPWNRERALLLLLGLGSLVLYIEVSGLRGWSRPGDVYTFLGLFALLFGLYTFALVRATAKHRRACLGTIFVFALCFRLALVPAGLGDDPGWGTAAGEGARAGSAFPWRDLAADLRGEVPYASHLLYDNDVWRYLWDGHQLAHGLDPYRLSPAEILERADDGEAPYAALLAEERWQDVHDHVAFQEYRTIYPPLAQWLFFFAHALAPASVVVWKLLLIGLDLGTCFLLLAILRRLGRAPGQVLAYAWNPLAVKEIAGSGHVDSLLVFCLTAALWAACAGWSRLSLAALGGAILAKLTPLLVVPFFLRRLPWRHWWPLPVIGALAYAPFLGSLPEMVSALSAFAGQWVFNPGLWLAFEQGSHLLGADGRAAADLLSVSLTLALLATVWRWHGRRCRDEGGEPVPDDAVPDDAGSDQGGPSPADAGRLAGAVAAVLGGYLLLSPTVMPWYLLWVLPAVVAAGPGSLLFRPWLTLTAASFLSYRIYLDGQEHPAWLAVEHGAVLALLAHGLWRGRRLADAPGAPPSLSYPRAP
ncbi:MAG: DUF2029 domain-containing protein [Holophagales bacterium]|nr:DUF2029 domain-containing protein [Holophagales bacterium]